MSTPPKIVPCDHPSCESGYITHTWTVCWPSEFSMGEPYETQEKCRKCNGEGVILETELEDRHGD